MKARLLDFVTSETYLMAVAGATLGLLPYIIFGRQ